MRVSVEQRSVAEDAARNSGREVSAAQCRRQQTQVKYQSLSSFIC